MAECKKLKFLFAVHDVTPAHLDKLIITEEVIEEVGIGKVCYLLVPDFHNLGQSHLHAPFMEWCRKPRNFEVEWFLHGYSHIELEKEKLDKLTCTKDRIRRIYYTGGEAEFMGLNSLDAEKRIRDGQKIFSECTGIDKPAGFVAPAWFFHPGLLDTLENGGYEVTEDHKYIYDLQTQRKVFCPVITWATRTWLWRTGSIFGCPLLEKLWRNHLQIRIAVHPHDFEHSPTVKSVRNVLKTVMNKRKSLSYKELIEAS